MSKSKQSDSSPGRDETLYCERCGISFLWTVEEQAQALADKETTRAAVRPSLCPGCRHLLPPAARERGLVKWYNARKRFGFISRQQAGDIFVHGSAVTGRQRLRPGDLVEFGVEDTERGEAASAVQVLQRAER